MPYRYLTLTAAVVSSAAATVISVTSARRERTVKAANYAVSRAGKALGETADDAVATAVIRAAVAYTTVIAATVVYIVVISATVVVIVVDLTATAAVVVKVFVSDGTSASAYVSSTV